MEHIAVRLVDIDWLDMVDRSHMAAQLAHMVDRLADMVDRLVGMAARLADKSGPPLVELESVDLTEMIEAAHMAVAASSAAVADRRLVDSSLT